MDGLLMKYFVLKPKGNTVHAMASREAMRAYAKCVQEENPFFAEELKTWAMEEARTANTTR